MKASIMNRCFGVFFCLLCFCARAEACDPCALYSASKLQGHTAGTFALSVSEQLTTFDRSQDAEENSIRNAELVRSFSTTQFAFSYDPTENFGVQATLPAIGRRYDAIENYRGDTSSDFDLGDAALLGTYSFLNMREADWTMLASVTGGVKFPTGDTGVLGEVSEEDELAAHAFAKHHQISTGSGGRALTFGTGSYDYIAGLSFLARLQRAVLLSTIQYTIRTEGDFNYEYADDTLWTVAPGYYFLVEHDYSVAGLVSFSGEFKGKDHLDGELVSGSQYSNLYVGPGVIFTVGEKIAGEVDLDFRVTGEDQGAIVVPEARLRTSLSYRF